MPLKTNSHINHHLFNSNILSLGHISNHITPHTATMSSVSRVDTIDAQHRTNSVIQPVSQQRLKQIATDVSAPSDGEETV